MANSLNKVQLIGNLTADPEIRETPNGQKVAAFSVATNRRWKDASGTLQEQTEFHNCVAWRWNADLMEQYTHKGKKVYIEGYLQTRSWDDPSGVKRYKTEIVTDNIILLSPAGSPSGEGNTPFDDKKNTFTAPAGTSESETTKASPADESTRTRAKVEEEISIEDVPF